MCVCCRGRRDLSIASPASPRPSLGRLLAAKDSVVGRPCPQFDSVGKKVSTRGISAAAGLEKPLVTRTERLTVPCRRPRAKRERLKPFGTGTLRVIYLELFAVTSVNGSSAELEL